MAMRATMMIAFWSQNPTDRSLDWVHQMAQSFWRGIMIQRSLKGAGRFRPELFLIVAGYHSSFMVPDLLSVRSQMG